MKSEPTIFRRRLRRLARLMLVCAISVPASVIVAYHLAVWLVPYHAELERLPRGSTAILDRHQQPLAQFVADDGMWRVPIAQEQVNPNLQMALIAVEDGRFYSHHGVDWYSAGDALLQQVIHPLSRRRGASTITMQVQRLRQPAARTWFTKLHETIVAGQIERRLSKQQILLEYINRAPFGGNLVGAEAASEKYFGRSCRQLSLGQAALLAGIPQSPTWLRPDRFPERARVRRNHVLDRMVACGFITQAQRDDAAGEPIDATWHAAPQSNGTPDGVLPTLWAIKAGRGKTVTTTLDAAMQRQTFDALNQQLQNLGASNIDAGAAVVLDSATSELLASVSIQTSGRQGNDLTRRPRSSGSTLKPFIYAAAFDAGIIGPKSILDDSPAAWPGYKPSDFDRAFRGQLAADEALAESRNIPAMLVLERVGIQPAAGVMAAAGLSNLAESAERFGLTLAVGGAEVSPIELAGAYAAIARGGTAKPVVTQIANQLPKSTLLLTSGACWQVLEAISNADRTRIVAPEAVRTHVAWKTGTSSGRRDAWCAAVTRSKTIVVWFGNVRGGGSASLVGQDAAAPVALRLMAALCPAQEPWPSAPNATRRPLVDRSASGSLVITSPAPGAQIVLSSDIARDHQRVLLNAAVKGDQASPALWWFVDDQPVSKSATAGNVWWNASPGAHVVRVMDSQLHSAVARISVR